MGREDDPYENAKGEVIGDDDSGWPGRTTTPAEDPDVVQWNSHRPSGVGAIGATEANRATAYVDTYGVSMEDALNMYTNWEETGEGVDPWTALQAGTYYQYMLGSGEPGSDEEALSTLQRSAYLTPPPRTPPGTGGATGGVTEADRIMNLLLGLELTDRQMKDAHLLGYALDEYAAMLRAAEIFDVPVGAIIQRRRAGEPLENIIKQADYVFLGQQIDAAPIGDTHLERVRNFNAAIREELTLDETAVAVAMGIPIERLGTVKDQLEDIGAEDNIDPRFVPTWQEAVAGSVAGITPFELSQRRAMGQKAVDMGIAAGGGALVAGASAETAAAGTAAIEEMLTGQAVGAEMQRAGEIPEDISERGLTYLGRQQALKMRQRAEASTPEELVRVMMGQKATSRQIRRALEARFGYAVVQHYMAGPSTYARLGGVMVPQYAGRGPTTYVRSIRPGVPYESNYVRDTLRTLAYTEAMEAGPQRDPELQLLEEGLRRMYGRRKSKEEEEREPQPPAGFRS